MAPHQHLFVCGLHRSGTTLLCRTLATHAQISGFANTGVLEDEGQFLQTVLPLDVAHGGVGRFGFDARAHMTEDHALNTPGNAQRILADWNRHWDLSRPFLVEKTPASLLRMRLLQALFPASRFIIMTRHPVAACLATEKWTNGNIFSLIGHWRHCHEFAAADCAFLQHRLWVSYEAFVADPRATLDRIAQWLGMPGWDSAVPQMKDHNARYFERWRDDYFGDGERAVPLVTEKNPLPLPQRLKQRLNRAAQEKSLPAWATRAHLRQHRDALDAVALHETAINRFGYSFADLGQRPAA